eukprot:580679-Pyramimonas_sp.AAC.1
MEAATSRRAGRLETYAALPWLQCAGPPIRPRTQVRRARSNLVPPVAPSPDPPPPCLGSPR